MILDFEYQANPVYFLCDWNLVNDNTLWMIYTVPHYQDSTTQLDAPKREPPIDHLFFTFVMWQVKWTGFQHSKWSQSNYIIVHTDSARNFCIRSKESSCLRFSVFVLVLFYYYWRIKQQKYHPILCVSIQMCSKFCDVNLSVKKKKKITRKRRRQ